MLRFFVYTVVIFSFSNVTASQVVVEHAPVIVEATKTFLDEHDTDYLSSHVSVISHEQFDTKVATVADVVRNETGVQIRQIGGLGSFSTVNIRGSNSKQVNVYLNGVLLNGAFGGAVDLSQFSLSNVEKIEIYRGNSPVTLGFSGIGGAINIITRDFSGKSTRQLKVGLGSLESRNIATSASSRIGANELFFSGEYLAAENNFGFEHNNLTPSYKGDDYTDRRNNADFEQVTSLFSLRREIGESLDLSWVTQFFDKDDHFPDVYNNEDTFAQLATDFLSTQIKFNYEYDRRTTFGFKFNVSEKKEHYQDTGNSVGVDTNDEINTSNNYGFNFLSSHLLGSHLLSASLETKREDYIKEDYILHNSFDYRRTHTILGLQDEWLSDSGDWQINLGGRYFHLEEKSLQIDKNDVRTYTNVHAGLLYTLSNELQFHSNVSRNIRIPQLYELYGDRGLFKGNNELEPEQALNADIGFRLRLSRIESKASIFYRYLKDGIFLSYGSTGVGKAFNISKSRVLGFEIDNSLNISERLSAQFKSTIQDSYEITASTDRDGNSLPGLYTLSNFLSASISDKQMHYTLEYRHQSGGYFDSSNEAPIPTQDQINISTKWKNPIQSLEIRVDNVTNNKFLDFNRYPIPGRRLFVVFKTTF